jgi:hypothetical protein
MTLWKVNKDFFAMDLHHGQYRNTDIMTDSCPSFVVGAYFFALCVVYKWMHAASINHSISSNSDKPMEIVQYRGGRCALLPVAVLDGLSKSLLILLPQPQQQQKLTLPSLLLDYSASSQGATLFY